MEVAGDDAPLGVQAIVRLRGTRVSGGCYRGGSRAGRVGYLPGREDEDGEADEDVQEVLRTVAEEVVPLLGDLDPVDEHTQEDLDEVEDEQGQADFLLAAVG